ncbi:hypothetical protein NDU88_000106 [Pleurodeles waltl]|uniref:Uncharacterized protein n=1 Tax=Pleurodeles waltl TaxID=8319 RepID=A0AAV7VV58_PLEWA|nr:hypothetical protein NDU88_000106 [Pleurodeles waltl]
MNRKLFVSKARQAGPVIDLLVFRQSVGRSPGQICSNDNSVSVDAYPCRAVLPLKQQESGCRSSCRRQASDAGLRLPGRRSPAQGKSQRVQNGAECRGRVALLDCPAHEEVSSPIPALTRPRVRDKSYECEEPLQKYPERGSRCPLGCSPHYRLTPGAYLLSCEVVVPCERSVRPVPSLS